MGPSEGTAFESVILHARVLRPWSFWVTPLSFSFLICKKGKFPPETGRSWCSERACPILGARSWARLSFSLYIWENVP